MGRVRIGEPPLVETGGEFVVAAAKGKGRHPEEIVAFGVLDADELQELRGVLEPRLPHETGLLARVDLGEPLVEQTS